MNTITSDHNSASLLQAKETLRAAVSRGPAECGPAVVGLAMAIHSDPEVSGEEHRASVACARFLEQRQFDGEWI